MQTESTLSKFAAEHALTREWWSLEVRDKSNNVLHPPVDLADKTTFPLTFVWKQKSVKVVLMSGEEVEIGDLQSGATVSDVYKKLQEARPLQQDAMYMLLLGDVTPS